jgi:tetraacyldisaccharide 4'-kinase
MGMVFDQWKKTRNIRELPRPVVSIGNITVGGTGKTPLTLWMAREVEKMGKTPCVLSRGYGSKTCHPRKVNLEGSDWREYGDEPLLMAEKLDRGFIYLGSSRWKAANLALKSEKEVDVFLLDDGFQHRQLKRDYDIVLLDAERGFGNQHLLPWGPLREPVESIYRADFIGTVYRSQRSPSSAQTASTPVEFPIGIGPVGWRRFSQRELQPLFSLPTDLPVRLVSGIGSPESFERTAQECGLKVAHHSRYRDHHPFTGTELMCECEEAKREGCRITTTAKDAVRMKIQQTVWTEGEEPIIIEVGVIAGDGLDHLRNVLKQLLA